MLDEANLPPAIELNCQERFERLIYSNDIRDIYAVYSDGKLR